ncbi:cupin domain-containing protein [Kitasatospora sp. DSM 101779]|uniref:cupin domain-containing protein n=1 Tax=Kitasatospora sp. DSM 101779 TaxID=2853165 RepID=UPI0021D89A2B|nr:cupin domain-containing protein [Kitasatospora sp. DSM 101779]MCU7825530.1 cupin domain-containing protein [Kitasatospora sp. DSM 101779]
MPVVRPDHATVFDLHGARFTSYASAATGAERLRAWRLDVPAGTTGVKHTVSSEEVLHLLHGTPVVTLDGEAAALSPGDTVVVPAGSRLQLDNPGPGPATAWVTTTAGLRATLPDGSVVSPPWAA